jgi:hypothetical protein
MVSSLNVRGYPTIPRGLATAERWCKPARHRATTPRMTETRGPDDDEGDRRTVNIVLAVGFVVLVGGGIWLANAMIDARNADNCIASGRRNCNPIDVPARER